MRSNDGQRTSVGGTFEILTLFFFCPFPSNSFLSNADLKRHRSHDPALIPRRHQSAGAEKTGGESQKTTTSLRETPKSAGKAARRSSSLRNEEHPADRVALANEALARERSSPYKQGNQQPPAATARFPAAGPASVGEFLLATAGDVSPQVPHKKKQPAVAPKPGQRQPPHRVDFSMSPPAGAPPKPGIVDSEAESENEETTLT